MSNTTTQPNLVSRYYPLSTMGPPQHTSSLVLEVDRKLSSATTLSSTSTTLISPSIANRTSASNGKSRENDLEYKYKRLKTKYFELEEKFKDLELKFHRAGNQVSRLKLEKDVYLDRILELEALAQSSSSPSSSNSPPSLSNAFPLHKPIKLNLPVLDAAFEESLLKDREDRKQGVASLDPTSRGISTQNPNGLRSRPTPAPAPRIVLDSATGVNGSPASASRPTKRARYSKATIDAPPLVTSATPNSRPTASLPSQLQPTPSSTPSKHKQKASHSSEAHEPLADPSYTASSFALTPVPPPHHAPSQTSLHSTPSAHGTPDHHTPTNGRTSSESLHRPRTASQARGLNPEVSQLQRTTRPKRLRASNVSTKTHNIPKVPRDLVSGTPLLPLTVGIMTVLKLGEISHKEHFHTERYIFPIGYEVTRRYFSTKDPNSEVVYNCQILDGGEGPTFRIVAADMPDQPIVAGTATGAWSGIVRAANLIRSRQHSNSVSGPDFFGLGQNTIKHLLQELPGVKELKNYVWQNFVEGGPLGGRHAAVVHAVQDDSAAASVTESPAPSEAGRSSISPRPHPQSIAALVSNPNPPAANGSRHAAAISRGVSLGGPHTTISPALPVPPLQHRRPVLEPSHPGGGSQPSNEPSPPASPTSAPHHPQEPSSEGEDSSDEEMVDGDDVVGDDMIDVD